MTLDLEAIRGRYAQRVWDSGHTPDYVRDIFDLIAEVRSLDTQASMFAQQVESRNGTIAALEAQVKAARPSVEDCSDPWECCIHTPSERERAAQSDLPEQEES